MIFLIFRICVTSGECTRNTRQDTNRITNHAALVNSTYMRSRGPGLEPFVVTSLVQLLCRTTKLCWFEDDQFSRTVEDAKRLLEKGSQGGSTVRPHDMTWSLMCRLLPRSLVLITLWRTPCEPSSTLHTVQRHATA